jgi:predicted component of type VI protein secretion system
MENDPYNPKKALWALLSDDARALFNKAKDIMTATEQILADREWAGADASYARTGLYELDSRPTSTRLGPHSRN